MIPQPVLAEIAHVPAVICAQSSSEWRAVLAQERDPGGAAGIFDPTTRVIYLPSGTCARLLHLPRWYRDVAEDAVTLGHEAAHAAGIADDAEADCFGARAAGYIVQRLGATKAYARAVGSAVAYLCPRTR